MNTKPANEFEPKEFDQQFFSALIRSDLAALDRILTNDFVLIDVIRGSEVSKSVLLSVIQSGQLRFETIASSDIRVRLYDRTAIINGRTQMHGCFGDAPFTVQSRYTHVYIQDQVQWRLASAQGTPIAPDA
jgi:hypothetical protein